MAIRPNFLRAICAFRFFFAMRQGPLVRLFRVDASYLEQGSQRVPLEMQPHLLPDGGQLEGDTIMRRLASRSAEETMSWRIPPR